MTTNRTRRPIRAIFIGAVCAMLMLGPIPQSHADPVGGDLLKPLILLIDVSSSMDGNGGNGMSKLDGAKAGMANAINGRSGNLVGLWTYPNDGGCGSGGYVSGAEPVDRQDPAMLKAIISGLSARGDTPTAQALEALGDDLTRRGFTSANIVLVSDGESNCSPPKPPCDVAADLVAKGFDITINTIGFSISDAGRNELTCIADTTHGRYVDVEDSSELIDEMQDQVNPYLKLTATSSPNPAMAGGIVDVTVNVSNASTQQMVSGVTLTLAFRADNLEDVMLPVVPPRVKIGNLPAGEQASKTWEFALNDLSVQNKRGVYRAVAYGFLVDGTFVDGQITIDTSNVETTGPFLWGVQIDGDDQIVIMGDSYSSGQGAGVYENWLTHETYVSVNDADACHTSQLTYGHDERYKIKNLACSGAVMFNFEAPQRADCDILTACWALSQFSKLTALSTPPRIVFLTIGGNDIGFADILARCINKLSQTEEEPGCSANSINDAYAIINNIAPSLQNSKSANDMDAAGTTQRLAKLYQQVWSDANSDAMRQERIARGGYEYAPVVVLPYVNLLDTTDRYPKCDVTHGALPIEALTTDINAADMKRLNTLEDKLNAAIASEVNIAQSGGRYGIYFADGVQRALDGHSICQNISDDSWIVPISLTSYLNSQAAHPTATGYRAIGQTLRTYLHSSQFDFSPDTTYEVGKFHTYCKVTTVPDPSDASVTMEAGTSENMTKCDYRWVVSDGYDPDSTAFIRFHSSTVTLASVQADADGKVMALIQIPGWVDAGTHTLTMSGIDANGDPREQSIQLHVTEQTPWYVWALAIFGVAALATSGVFTFLSLRRNKRTRTNIGQDSASS